MRLEGPEALEYLQSQVSQDLTDLAVPGRVRTLLLAPAGTVVAVGAVIVASSEAVEIEVPEGLGEAVRTRLERFAIRAALAVRGPIHVEVATDPGLADERSRIDARIPGPRELDKGLVAHGLDPTLLAECVSFTKGCYPGQELVARMESRHAMPPYVLRHLLVPSPVEVGTPAGDSAFDGQVTSVVEVDASTWHALCVLHRRDAAAPQVDVHSEAGTVQATID